MPEPFTMDTFAGLEGSKFTMRYVGGQTAEIELVSVTDVGSSSRQMQFSLIFLGPEDGPIGQGICTLEHEKLGSLDLFLVAIGRDQRGVQYEAIFNRMIE